MYETIIGSWESESHYYEGDGTDHCQTHIYLAIVDDEEGDRSIYYEQATIADIIDYDIEQSESEW